MKSPNIIFILADHQLFHGHSNLGNNKIKRPYFDSFAKEGTVFKNAYSVCPLCTPARRTMLTGLYPHNHKEIHCNWHQPFTEATYMDILATGGYKNYYYGKWHAGEDTPFEHSCTGFCPKGNSYGNPYTSPEYKQYLKNNNLPEPTIDIDQNFCEAYRYPDVAHGTIYKQDKAACNEDMSGTLLSPKETHESFFISSMVCDKIKEISEEKSSEPFSISVNFWAPHQPYFPTKEYLDMYNPDEIQVYPSFNENVKVTKPSIYDYNRYRDMSKDEELIYPSAFDWKKWQKVIAHAYAQSTMVDEAAGKILETLKKYGMDKDTIVIWTADHGDALASHGGNFNKGCYLSEEVLRIPMAVRYPDVVPANKVCDTIVGNVDIAPTIIDAANLPSPHKMDGVSLIKSANDCHDKKRTYIVSETYGLFIKHFGRALIKNNIKYIYNMDNQDELYDLAKDPYEMKNLIDSDEYAEVLLELRSDMKDFAHEHNDEFLKSICNTSGKFPFKLREKDMFPRSCPWYD